MYLAREGADVALIDICQDIASVPYPLATKEDLEHTAQAVREEGVRAYLRIADVRDKGEMVAAFAEASKALAIPTIVVANAGVWPMLEHPDAWRDAIDVNLTGVHNTVEAAIPELVRMGRGGSLILISSSAGLTGIGGRNCGALGYAASKHGLVGLMRCYANNLAPYWIRVNSVHPTSVISPMIMNPARDEWISQNSQPGSTHNALPVTSIEASDVSHAVVYLASDEARYVTGVAFPVDAGFVNAR